MTYSEKHVTKLMKVIIIAFLISLTTYTFVPAQSTIDTTTWSGNPDTKAKRDYTEIIQKIFAVGNDNVEVIRAGSVSYDNITYPVYALSYTPPKNPVIRVFLAAGQHGNEPASADAVIDFFEYIKSNKNLYSDIAVDAIPMINPWGWVYNTRFGGGRHDINRDFYRFYSQEARVVRDFVQGKSYDFMIDHHESPSDGAFIFNYDEEMFDICNRLMNYLRGEKYGIGERGYFHDRILINGINDIPSRRRSRTRNFNDSRQSFWRTNSTIVRYFNTTFNTYGFTMETSTYKLYKYRVECHFDVMRFMTAAFREYAVSSKK